MGLLLFAVDELSITISDCLVNTFSDKNITPGNMCMILKVKKKEPGGSLREDIFRPLGLYYLADYSTIFITFNCLISGVRV